jgi:hypothetical protein
MAKELLERRELLEPGLTRHLKTDIKIAVESRDDLTVQYETNHASNSNCSIAAAYLRDRKPPRIVIGPTKSRGRLLFSIGHEFGHFLIDQDEVLADLLWKKANKGVLLEEEICDAFAALLLVGDDLVDQALAGDGVTAAAVIRLWLLGEASREACAVAMAQCLLTPGYVVIGARERQEDGDETIIARFAARAHGVFPIRRGTAQPGTLLENAHKHGRASGQDQLIFPSGARTDVFHADIARNGEYLFGVFVTDNPGWGGLSVRDPDFGGYPDAWCDWCSEDFRPQSAACKKCEEYICPKCGKCSCYADTSPAAKICPGCWTERPGRMFHGIQCDICVEEL